MSILKVRDAEGKVYEIPALRGPKGPKGDKGDKGDTADGSLFANAVKGNLKGEVVQAIDVSPVEHIVNVKVDHPDPTSVAVTRYGKNLLLVHQNLATKTVNGVTFTVNEDKSVTCNGTALDTAVFKLTPNYRLPIGVYTLRGCPIDGHENVRLQTNKVINGVEITGAMDNGNGGKLSVDDEYDVFTYIAVLKGITVSNVTFKPMLQLATDSDTSYEIPIYETYTPNADGTVDGITSLSPTMTLTTDTAGAVINCEYNRDLNVVIKNIAKLLGSEV